MSASAIHPPVRGCLHIQRGQVEPGAVDNGRIGLNERPGEEGEGDGEGDGFGFVTEDAEAAEPEAMADHPSRAVAIHSRSAAPSAGARFVIARSPMAQQARLRESPGLCQIFGAGAPAHWSQP